MLAKAAGHVRSVVRADVGEEEIGLGGKRLHSQSAQLRRQILCPGSQLPDTILDLVLMLERCNRCRLTRLSQRVRIVMTIEIVGQIQG